METNKKNQEPSEEQGNSLNELSQEALLNKIDHDASDAGTEGSHEGNDLIKKLSFGKKDKLKKELEEQKQQYLELHDKYLRLFADFDNFRKRGIKERIELIRTAGSDMIISLLPVLDDFQRALAQSQASADPMLEGVRLIYQKLNAILENKGLKPMNSIGEEFNPELHDAISEIAVTDENMKGKVADEIERGYYLNDKIIRHAKVVVGK